VQLVEFLVRISRTGVDREVNRGFGDSRDVRRGRELRVAQPPVLEHDPVEDVLLWERGHLEHVSNLLAVGGDHRGMGRDQEPGDLLFVVRHVAARR